VNFLKPHFFSLNYPLLLSNFLYFMAIILYLLCLLNLGLFLSLLYFVFNHFRESGDLLVIILIINLLSCFFHSFKLINKTLFLFTILKFVFLLYPHFFFLIQKSFIFSINNYYIILLLKLLKIKFPLFNLQ
jgi:hypothetical protein